MEKLTIHSPHLQYFFKIILNFFNKSQFIFIRKLYGNIILEVYFSLSPIAITHVHFFNLEGACQIFLQLWRKVPEGVISVKKKEIWIIKRKYMVNMSKILPKIIQKLFFFIACACIKSHYFLSECIEKQIYTYLFYKLIIWSQCIHHKSFFF